MKRGGPLTRSTPLTRTAALTTTATVTRTALTRSTRKRSRPPAPRVWTAAQAKKHVEGRCRLCGVTDGLEAAHTIGRAHDPIDDLGRRVVRAADVIPLCGACHREYDARRLSILEVLSYGEQAAAVEHVGLLRALARLTGA